MYSFVIKTAIEVNRAELDDITTVMLGLIPDKVEVVNVEADPIKISVIIKNTFFLSKDLYFFL